MNDFTDVLLKGGPVALILAAAYSLRWIIEAFKFGKKNGRHSEPPAITDAATTNAMLLEALKAERETSAKKDDRIEELEEHNDQIQRDRYSERAAYEEIIADLRRKLQELSMEVAAFEARLKSDLPHPPTQH